MADKDKILAASFFFGYDYLGYGRHDSIHQFFPTIACHLALSVRQVVPNLINSLSEKRTDYLKDQFHHDHPKVLITDPLRNVDMGPMVVVVDALDACNGGDLLANELVSIARSLKCPLRFLVTSRPEDYIRDAFVGPDIIEATSLDVLDAWDSQQMWD